MKLTATLGLPVAVALALPLAAQDTISVGSRPDHTFREAPVNAMGVKSLGDLRGRPVLVDFWGTR